MQYGNASFCTDYIPMHVPLKPNLGVYLNVCIYAFVTQRLLFCTPVSLRYTLWSSLTKLLQVNYFGIYHTEAITCGDMWRSRFMANVWSYSEHKQVIVWWDSSFLIVKHYQNVVYICTYFCKRVRHLWWYCKANALISREIFFFWKLDIIVFTSFYVSALSWENRAIAPHELRQ